MGLEVSKLKNIKMLVLDVDGILTDCRVWMDANGEWRRFFSLRDGAGIVRLIERGFKIAVITASKSKDIQYRVKHLGIHYFFEGNMDKIPAFEQLQKESGISASEMAYMGDDFFDIPLLQRVAFAATVPEAVDEVKPHVHYVTQRPGGNGAVREICDYLFKYGAYGEAVNK
jgi:3-deoxy-D-manno-octulosonate 8-phosphate phosphatase (KDO 8-P phosphatase)